MAIAELEIFDPAKDAARRELAEANKAVNEACSAVVDAGRARLAAMGRLVEARQKAADLGIEG